MTSVAEPGTPPTWEAADTSVRCPSCEARLRAGSEWCSLCSTDLRPPPPPSVPSVTSSAAGAVDPLTAPIEAVEGRRGRHARGAATSPAPTEADSTAPVLGAPAVSSTGAVPDAEMAAMMAQLSTQSRDSLGPLARRMSEPGAKLTVIIGGGMALAVGLVLLMTVLGALS